MIAIYENINDLAKWLSQISIRYDKPILVVVSEFTKAMDMYLDYNMAKLHTVSKMSMEGA
ncbi:MAG: hypothetical protein AB9856_14305 [Cellulosilyticaceae bacterium]